MGKQLSIEVPIQKGGYSEALEEYNATVKNRNLLPVFLCYNSNLGKFLVTTFFQESTIKSFNYKIIK